MRLPSARLTKPRSLAQRAFALLAVPVLLVTAGGFGLLDYIVRAGATRELSHHLEQTEAARRADRMASEAQLRQLVAVLADSAGLKAGILLHRELEQAGTLEDPAQRAQAAATLQEQLADLNRRLSFDQFVLADEKGVVLAALPAVARFDATSEILENQGAYLGMVTVPILREAELVGYVSVGTKLDFSASSKRLLLKGDQVLASAIPGLTFPRMAAASGGVSAFEMAGRRYVGHRSPRGEYTVVELAEVDGAIAPLLTTLRTALVSMATISLLVCLVLSVAATNALSRPLREFSELLAQASLAGVLPSELPSDEGITEMRQFKRSFEEAARAVSRSREELEQAYVHFMEAMAEALDARDAYTAGHSRRVADYSVAIARALALPAEQIERLRIGAMLHDIGKIGIPDSVLLKHERLTEEEFALIRQHPAIGRRILERIGRFQPYLAAVELHHENHDGTGYPHRLRGEEIPLEARIVHVADAYDAMTSNRPYRQRMPEEKVRRILAECAGTQFDPRIVEIFLGLPDEVLTGISKDLEKLSHAIRAAQGSAAVVQPGRDGVPVAGTRV